MKRINVGVIGTGFIGPAHIEALRRLGYVNVSALADIDEQTAKQKADQMNIPAAYGDYRDLLKDANIDAVHICTPNFLHYAMVKEALLAGKHVVCEKPLAMTSEEAAELVRISKEKGLMGAVGFNLRFYPLIQQVKSMIEKDELGDILAINGSYQQDWLLYQTDYNWRIDSKMSGDSRAIADIGSHWLDMAEFLTGRRIQSVCADFATFHKTRKKPKKDVETYSGKMKSNDDYDIVPINTEDYASVLLRFDRGAHGSLTVNQTAAGRKNRIYFEIYGAKKSVAWSGERPNELWIGNRSDANQIMMKDPSLMRGDACQYTGFPGGHNEGFPDTSKQFFAQFYSCVLNKDCQKPQEMPFASFEAGLRELVLNEKICESAKKMCWVNV